MADIMPQIEGLAYNYGAFLYKGREKEENGGLKNVDNREPQKSTK